MILTIGHLLIMLACCAVVYVATVTAEAIEEMREE
jgi:hypothetical protein